MAEIKCADASQREHLSAKLTGRQLIGSYPLWKRFLAMRDKLFNAEQIKQQGRQTLARAADARSIRK
jgi:glutaredoxin-related protein